ncbi:hypothetical protein LP415_19790 [Polaromonas sp. P1(28)-8]|nr:hypothetical protein LP415_19790 [Polaromonas sp. P1(28)-8]
MAQVWRRFHLYGQIPQVFRQALRQSAENHSVLKYRILQRLTLTLGLGLAVVLQGCVYVPRTTQVFDPECQRVSNHMVLQEVQVAAIHNCANEACIALVVGAGIVTAASVVISGPIVVAGNVVYWFEKKPNAKGLNPDSAQQLESFPAERACLSMTGDGAEMIHQAITQGMQGMPQERRAALVDKC